MGVRAHPPDDAVPTDDDVGDELDQKHHDAHYALHRGGRALRDCDVNDEVVFGCRREVHPNETEPDPVIRLHEVVDRHEPHEDD